MKNPIKPNLKTEILPILLLAIAGVLSFYFYAHFPEQVPTHWNLAGEVDAYGPRAVAAFLIPAVILGMYLLFLFLPIADPKKERYDQFKKTYHIFKFLIIFFMFILYVATSLNAIGYYVNVGMVVPLMVGTLFVILGNYMSKIKTNWFMGIRTPWTLSSEEVWNKTHRFGGKAFMLGGLMIASTAFAPIKMKTILFFSALAIMILGTVLYSYLAYLKEKK